MTVDKRKGEKAIPDHVSSYLSHDQQAVLHKIEGFGWELKIVRRPLFEESVVIVISPDGKSIGVLEKDGRLNMQADISLREE
jgi:hypothetical protein